LVSAYWKIVGRRVVGKTKGGDLWNQSVQIKVLGDVNMVGLGSFFPETSCKLSNLDLLGSTLPNHPP